MSIQSLVIPDRQLTIHTVHGALTLETLMTALKAYNFAQPTTKVMWDFRETRLTTLTADQIRTLIHFASQYDYLRPGGKTVLLVSSRPGDYGMARMAEIMNNIEKSEIIMQVFRDYEQALHWLEAKT